MTAPKENCNGCHACYSICPNNCISMKSDSEGFLQPEIDKSKCMNCGKCTKVCPVMNKIKTENQPVAYAAYNKDEQIRLNSSSGGVFTLLAEWIIDNGGVVFGACFDADFSVIHNVAETKKELQKFRGSKYVQSQIGDKYKMAKEYLAKGRLVLFTGTPCQIGGLKAYLGKEYENLFTQDLICHGVPSPKVWEKYVRFRENRAGSPAQRISFRRKNDGWKRFSVLFSFENNTEYLRSLDKDLMMQAFLKNICLRQSCHECAYKTIHRQSDITLADFWGIQNVLPQMDDDKGTSLVIINSNKGAKLFNEIRNNLIYEAIDFNNAISYNSAAVKSVPAHKNRAKFFRELENREFDKLVKKYCSENYIFRIMRILKNKGFAILKRVFKR